MTDYLKEGQQIRVKVLDVDARGRIKLSMKEVIAEEGGTVEGSAAEAVEEQPKAELAPVADSPETTEE